MNTPAELAEYDKPMNSILDRVFDEYSLVVCSWSGVYDTALRDALKRRRSRRFTTYWASRGKPGETAKAHAEKDWSKGWTPWPDGSIRDPPPRWS